MNPFSKLNCFTIKVEKVEEVLVKLQEFLKEDKYTAVVCPIDSTSFELAITVNTVTREMALPFYSPNSTGLQGFFFADLGKNKFDYSYVKKSKVEGEADEQIMAATEGSRGLKNFFDEFTDP